MPRTAKGFGSDPVVTPRLRAALIELVERGASIEQAALRAGLKPESLQKSLRKAHVLAARSELRARLRDNVRDRAFHKVADLVGGAKSEYVQLDASKFALGLAGESVATAPVAIDGRGSVNFVLIVPPGAVPLAREAFGPGINLATRPALEGPQDEPMTIAAPEWREKEGISNG